MNDTGNATMQKVMLLIDADNVSVDVMEQAVHRVLAAHGHLHVRRAYGTPEVAMRHQALFKRLSIRPMVNLAAGKNSTDIALAVDAMDLAISERPQVVYLVSSDSDFAPLVLRLREKGCRVCGIGQAGKTGEETTIAYDDFIDLRHNSAPESVASSPASGGSAQAPASAQARKPARKAAARTPAAKKVPAVAASAAPAAKKAPAKAARKKTVSAKAAAASEAAEFILQAVPALRNGGEVELKDVAQALRAAKLLGKHASSIKLFEKLPAEFTVMQHPDRIRWIGAAVV